jgi:hypothetical protein
MFCKGGPGKNHRARLPGGLVGLEGLSFILSCTEPWNTVYTHLVQLLLLGCSHGTFSIVLLFRLTSGPWNTSPYMATIRGRINCQARFCRSWPNILSPNIRVSSPVLQQSGKGSTFRHMLLLRFLMREEMYLDSVSTDIGHTPIRRSVGFWLTTIFFYS